MNVDAPDAVRAFPPQCKALIARHKRTYPFTDLVPMYGYEACRRLVGYWEKIYNDINEETTYNEFRLFKRMLRDIALSADDSAKSVFGALSSCKLVPRPWLSDYVGRLRARMLDPDDTTFTDAGGSSVIKYLETLRNCLNRFAMLDVLPSVELSTQGMYGDDTEVKTPCFATLLIEAGRLKLDGDNDRENALKFHIANRTVLEALRSSLVEVFKSAQDRFEERNRLLANPNIPSPGMIVRAMRARAALRGAHARGKRGLADLLEGTEDYVRGVALRAFITLYHRRKIPVSRFSLNRLLQEAGGVEFIAKLAEPCGDTLMAAATLVQIDTGWEASTVLNMDLDPFVGEIKKNSITVRAIVSKKNRAQGKLRNAALVDAGGDEDNPDQDAKILLKQKGAITAYQVILAYKSMTADIRHQIAARQSNKLWLTRGARGLNRVVYDAFRCFLDRHQAHTILGGLPLTRRSIKRTKYNVDAESDVGNIGLTRAKGDHSSSKLAFAYLSAPAVRAIFKNKIREYLQQMEAVVYATVDDLAEKLKIPLADLNRRKLLGIDNGLAALLAEPRTKSSSLQAITAKAQTLKPDNAGLRSLVIAGFGIDARWEEMSTKNPHRFLRVWVPWMALIQAMVQKIMITRHRAKFRRVFDEVRKEIDAGALALPIIW
ncbi:hypothetical protein [Rhizobium hidalgonense]|nr:hypothetical protein [Rhizobium hidalgonense]